MLDMPVTFDILVKLSRTLDHLSAVVLNAVYLDGDVVGPRDLFSTHLFPRSSAREVSVDHECTLGPFNIDSALEYDLRNTFPSILSAETHRIHFEELCRSHMSVPL